MAHLISDVQLLNQLSSQKSFLKTSEKSRETTEIILGKKGKNQREVLFPFKTAEI